jgi:double-stranded uracil-DNA glycosylase
MEQEPLISCLPPLASVTAKLLILGSFPGTESLRKQEYYGHPRNAFWSIMDKLLNLGNNLSYPEKVKALTLHRIAVWDVFLSCRRRGSLDSSIEDATVNDFASFFQIYQNIEWVVFNGARAEMEYRRHVLQTVIPIRRELTYFKMPSTSPAMAILTSQEKMARWAKIEELLFDEQ